MNTLWLIPFLCVLASCSSLRVDLPASRMESPETNGNGAKRMAARIDIKSMHDYVFTDDASNRPPNLDAPKAEKSGAFGVFGSYGLAEYLDLSVSTTAGPSPWMLKAKYQFIGDNQEFAQPGTFSMAATIGAGYGTSAKSGDQDGRFGPGGHDWSSNTKVSAQDFALILGYRVNSRLLLYTGGFYSHYNMDGRIEHKVSSDGSSPAANYDRSAKASQRGFNFGLNFDFGLAGIIMLEGVYSDLQATNAHDWLFSYGISVGARF